jgi:hypothetical protein
VGLIGLGAILLQLRRLADVIESRPMPLPLSAPPQVAAALAVSDAKPPVAEVVAQPAPQPVTIVAPAPVVTPPAPVAAQVAPVAAAPEPVKAPAAAASATLRADPATRIGVVAAPPETAAAPISVAAPAPPIAPPPVAAPVAAAPKVETVMPKRDGDRKQPPSTEGLTVLKSGVIEGMAYTLYSNGAVDADLPQQGTMRFASIAEWRTYIRAAQ